ncbi:hypothetical protein D9757_006153 [Collybiopsis confluens]|uniref:Uncharacterized protein n=1 Tax=Collybiopsis confluens TaxID=2823264 RepID=A0A8H5HHS1_9AGAR|nr:hypothetical protein D9757_006153 [Collybiopsis confluens]
MRSHIARPCSTLGAVPYELAAVSDVHKTTYALWNEWHEPEDRVADRNLLPAAMTTPDVHKLCDIVSDLGGPFYSPAQLEWATQIPSGKFLFHWLTNQLPPNGLQRAALAKIALDRDQVEMLQRSGKWAQSHADHKSDLSKYVSPSRQNARNTLRDNSAFTLEQQAELLQHRLKQTKLSPKKKLYRQPNLQETTHNIKAEVDRAEDRITEKQQDLGQLSLQTCSVLSNLRSHSSRLFQSLQDDLNLDISQTLLVNLYKTRNRITQDATVQLDAINASASQLPNVKRLESETMRLQCALGLNETSGSTLSSLAEDAAYLDHIEYFTTALEQIDNGNGEIYDVLQELGSDIVVTPEPLDIRREVEQAWNSDQSLILESECSVLEQASLRFEQSVLLPLQYLHTFLAEQKDVARETLAIHGVFEEETDEIIHELDAPLSGPSDIGPETSDLEAELKTLLKELRAFQLSDSPPLVLLDEQDVLAELKALRAREESLDAQEEARCDSIATALNALMSTHEAALNATYAHSTLWTSEPYQLSPSIHTLQNDAKDKGASLTAEVQRIQQQDLKFLDDSKTKRKLKSFVERRNVLSV